MATYVGDANRDSIKAQATATAWRTGISPEKALYDWAQSQGYDAAGIDTAMGLDAGATQSWLDRPTSVTPAPAAQGNNPAASINGATSYVGDTNRDSIIQQAQARAQLSGKTAEQELWDYSKSQGIDATGIDQRMGSVAGSTASWAQKNIPNYQSNTGITAATGGPSGTTATPLAGGSLADQQAATAPQGMPVFNAVTSTAGTTGPSSWVVDQNQLASSQLASILKDDSPLMQQARTQGMQTAASRGLLNSSMAGTAGESAMISAASPLATSNANTYAQAAQSNAGAANTFSSANNDFLRNAAMANFNVQANDWSGGQSYLRNLGLQESQNTFTAGQNDANRAFTTSERIGGQNFTAGQNDANRTFQTGERVAGQNFTSTQNDANHAFTNQQNVNQNNFTSAQNNDARTATTQRDTAAAANAEKTAATTAINSARADFNQAFMKIQASSDMSSELKKETISGLRASYNTIIAKSALVLGWNDPASWLINAG